MDYAYYLASGNLKINTPGISSFSDIKTEILYRDEKKAIIRVTYPNGFCFEAEIAADFVAIRSNRPLRENEDGSFTMPTDI